MSKHKYKDLTLHKDGLRQRLGQLKPRTIYALLFLAALVILNFFYNSDDPHFYYDQYPGFWPIFGLIAGLVMILVMKKIVQPLIKRKEDFYGDI